MRLLPPAFGNPTGTFAQQSQNNSMSAPSNGFGGFTNQNVKPLGGQQQGGFGGQQGGLSGMFGGQQGGFGGFGGQQGGFGMPQMQSPYGPQQGGFGGFGGQQGGFGGGFGGGFNPYQQQMQSPYGPQMGGFGGGMMGGGFNPYQQQQGYGGGFGGGMGGGMGGGFNPYQQQMQSPYGPQMGGFGGGFGGGMGGFGRGRGMGMDRGGYGRGMGGRQQQMYQDQQYRGGEMMDKPEMMPDMAYPDVTKPSPEYMNRRRNMNNMVSDMQYRGNDNMTHALPSDYRPRQSPPSYDSFGNMADMLRQQAMAQQGMSAIPNTRMGQRGALFGGKHPSQYTPEEARIAEQSNMG